MFTSAVNCILFDLDGTLIDGVDDLVAAINVVLRDSGLTPVDRALLEPMLGDGMRALAQRVFAAHGVTAEGEALDQLARAYLAAYKATRYHHTRLFNGVADTLRALHAQGWRIGLASNKLTEPCEQILRRLGVYDFFTVIVGSDAAGVRKPDPGHLRHALAGLGFDAARGDRAVMVGDHANDIRAARGCGIVAIAVAFATDPARARGLGADALLTDFRDLPAALAQLLAV
ncbi:MAG: HAD-IA family hydrolase [Pseudomonadales bacterium]|jgi:phosphoglycolate phosphatase|nr:HAD-IA family hydrolase [Pseudomonadales bacterium]